MTTRELLQEGAEILAAAPRTSRWRPSNGWTRLPGPRGEPSPVWEHPSGMRLHSGGLVRMPDGTTIYQPRWRTDAILSRHQPKQRRKLMVWAELLLAAQRSHDTWQGAFDNRSRLPVEFRQEYMGIPVGPERGPSALRALALEYVNETEAYDRMVCTGPIKRGGIMAADGHEFRLINKNAFFVMERKADSAVKLGFTRRELRREISITENTLDRQS